MILLMDVVHRCIGALAAENNLGYHVGRLTA
jgi:hypothetical protein